MISAAVKQPTFGRTPISVNVRITSNGRFIVKNAPTSVPTTQPPAPPSKGSVVVPDSGSDGSDKS